MAEQNDNNFDRSFSNIDWEIGQDDVFSNSTGSSNVDMTIARCSKELSPVPVNQTPSTIIFCLDLHL